MSSGWLLGVDFGTSNTAAAHVTMATGDVQTLPLTHGGNLMPSSVFVVTPTQIDVGDVALNKAASDPSRFVAGPKRGLTVGQTTFDVDSGRVHAHVIVAAVLRSVLMRAVSQHQGLPPSGLVLTHPEAWSPQQVEVLTDAAAEIGFNSGMVRTVSEPQAAAHYYSRTAAIAPGATIAVFDFGGGTLDIAVLRAGQNGQFELVAAHGDNSLGGANFDAAVQRWVEDQLEESNPQLLHALREASSRDVRELQKSIRAAKEVLSEVPSASIEVRVAGQYETLSLTRREFEELITPEVTRGVELTRSTLSSAGITGPQELQAIYLTGGSSRVPLVHRHLQAIGPVATLDDPKTVVARGALVAALRQSGPTPHRTQHSGPQPAQHSAPMPTQYSAPQPQQPQQPQPQQRQAPPPPPSRPQPSRQQPEPRRESSRDAMPAGSRRKMLIGVAVGVVVVIAASVGVAVAMSGGGEEQVTVGPESAALPACVEVAAKVVALQLKDEKQYDKSGGSTPVRTCKWNIMAGDAVFATETVEIVMRRYETKDAAGADYNASRYSKFEQASKVGTATEAVFNTQTLTPASCELSFTQSRSVVSVKWDMKTSGDQAKCREKSVTVGKATSALLGG